MEKLFLGKAITQLREARNMSQVDLADTCGIRQPTLSLYESGKRTPSEKNLDRIASALDLSAANIRFESIKLRNEWAHGVNSQPPVPVTPDDPSVIYITDGINVKFHVTVRDNKNPNPLRYNPVTNLVERVLRDYIEDNRDEIEELIAETIENSVEDVTKFLDELKRKR